MKEFEQKALDYYGEVVINKGLIHNAGFGARSIPTYVGEWLLSHFIENDILTEEARKKISAFLERYLPSKGEKDEVKNRLLNPCFDTLISFFFFFSTLITLIYADLH